MEDQIWRQLNIKQGILRCGQFVAVVKAEIVFLGEPVEKSRMSGLCQKKEKKGPKMG